MKTRISFVFCLCAVALACGCGSRSGVKAAKKGLAAFKEGRNEKAIAYFTTATQQITNDAELYYHLGLAHLRLGNLVPAQEAFQAALDSKPAELKPSILGSLGQVAFHQKEYTNALVVLRQALAASQDDATAVRVLTTMGAVEACCKNPSLASLYYLRALKLDYRYAPAHYNLAVLYQDQHNLYAEALDSFGLFMSVADKKDKKRREVEETRIPRLKAKLERERPRVNINPNATRAGTLLQTGGNAYAAKDYTKAIKAYKDALVADPGTFSAAYGLGNIYRQQKMYAEALTYFKNASDINPTNQDSYYQAAEVAMQLKQPAEATKILSQAIARSPYNPASLRLMAQAFAAQARIPEAIAYGEFYLSLVPATDPDRTPFEKWVHSLKQR